MKIKVTKVKPVKDMALRVSGIAVFRITGPDPRTGERVTFDFTGTRPEAEAEADAVFNKKTKPKEIL